MKQLYGISTAVLATAMVAAISPSSANAQDSATVDISASTTYASNAFSEAGDDTEGVAASIEVAPTFQWTDERSTLSLRGSVRYDQWIDDDESDLAGSAQLAASSRLDENTSVYGAASFRSSRRTLRDFLLGDGLLLEDPDVVPPTFEVDPTFGDRFSRRTSAGVSGGITQTLSPTQTLSLGVDSQYNWIGDDLGDYRTHGATISYGQRLGPRSRLVVTVGGGLSDYDERPFGDSVYGNGFIGVEFDLSETGTFNINGGVGISDTDVPDGIDGSRATFLANAQLCERVLNGRLCASGGRSLQPTALGGASTVTNASFGWVTSDLGSDSFGFNARYSKVDSEIDVLGLTTLRGTEFVGLSARYSRAISEKLDFYIAPSFSKILDDTLDRKANYQAEAGLRLRLGR